ncbi:MAG: hypothetical protein IKT38_00145 [Clostridia bacterium]|nr:hypothetical protein [Clostridia bacterium]
MGAVIGIILLVIVGFFVIVMNGYTFIISMSYGPTSPFSQNQSVLLILLFATIALPGVILGTIVGIITFQWTNW